MRRHGQHRRSTTAVRERRSWSNNRGATEKERERERGRERERERESVASDSSRRESESEEGEKSWFPKLQNFRTCSAAQLLKNKRSITFGLKLESSNTLPKARLREEYKREEFRERREEG